VAFPAVLKATMRAEPQPLPPKLARAPAPAFFLIIALAMAVLVSGAALFFFDPAKHGFFPVCLFHELTGWNCPGCGGTRAAYELLHGHLLRALHDNALLVVALAALAVWGAGLLVQRMRRRPAPLTVPAGVWWVAVIVTLAFTGLRNLPAFAWLSP
jgi:hypothetical protein